MSSLCFFLRWQKCARVGVVLCLCAYVKGVSVLFTRPRPPLGAAVAVMIQAFFFRSQFSFLLLRLFFFLPPLRAFCACRPSHCRWLGLLLGWMAARHSPCRGWCWALLNACRC